MNVWREVACKTPEKAKTKGEVENGIEADCFSRRGRKRLTLGNEGAVDKPVPRVAHGGAITPLEHVGSPSCSAVNSPLSVLLYFP